MNENIQKFLEKLGQDPELLKKMSAIRDPEEAYKLASSVQDGFTKEEFLTAMKALEVANGDLNDDDLKKYAGGVTDEELTIGISIATSLVGTGPIYTGAALAAI